MPKKGAKRGGNPRPKKQKKPVNPYAAFIKAHAKMHGKAAKLPKAKKVRKAPSKVKPPKRVPSKPAKPPKVRKFIAERKERYTAEVGKPETFPKYVQPALEEHESERTAILRWRKERAKQKKVWAGLVKTLPEFTKDDAGKVYHVALPTPKERKQGKRWVTQGLHGKRKSFTFFVRRDGSIKVVTEKGAPAYVRPITLKLAQKTPKYAHKSFYTEFTSMYPELVDRSGNDIVDECGNVMRKYPCINPTPKEEREKTGITWDRVTSYFTRHIREWMAKEPKSNINYAVTIRELIVEDVRTGEKHRYCTFKPVEFKSRALQRYKPKGMEKFTGKMMYAHFAQMLSLDELVTTGSAAYIHSHYNFGDSRTDRSGWTDDMGNPWRKRDFDLVRIRHICFDIASLKTVYSKQSVKGESIDEEIG